MNTETKVDFRTPLQKKRDERDEKLNARFNEINATMPDKSKWLIWRAIGNEFGMKPQGVRAALNRIHKKITN
jgi:hypothetical protein